ncbi:MAG TPA: hypothetical protein PLX89_01525 [Verrucomicrobiota bacterium]|nr:hypothetical protein [Verrucomicrobiales bacterium]HRI11658.1 hypothetical protein [Verrucomicrobiota bacterium]
MKSLENQLERLLRSAARAPRPAEVTELSGAAEARVLAAWRRSQPEGPSWMLRWLQGGLAAAAVAAAVALGLNWTTFRQQAADEYAVADAALYAALTP